MIPEEETLEEIRVHFDKVLEWCQWNGDRCQQMASLLCGAVNPTSPDAIDISSGRALLSKCVII